MTPVSFLIDHTKLLPGIYLQAEPGKCYTYDLRFVAPKESAIKGVKSAVMHTYEHCFATYLRANAPFKDNILYIGPMGCCTGFYMILNAEVDFKTIGENLCGAFKYIIDLDEIPAANAIQCGNYLLNDLQGAKELSKVLLEVFSADFPTVYPEV